MKIFFLIKLILLSIVQISLAQAQKGLIVYQIQEHYSLNNVPDELKVAMPENQLKTTQISFDLEQQIGLEQTVGKQNPIHIDYTQLKKYSYYKSSKQQLLLEAKDIPIKKAKPIAEQKQILGYYCSAYMVKEKGNSIKVWVSEKGLSSLIHYGFMLKNQKGAILAWEDKKGNSVLASEIQLKGPFEAIDPIPFQEYPLLPAVAKQEQTAKAQALKLNEKMPSFKLIDLEGKLWNLSTLKNKAFLLCFIGGMNREDEIQLTKELEKLQEAYPKLVFLCLIEGSASRVSYGLNIEQIKGIRAFADISSVRSNWDIDFMPSLILVNTEHKIAYISPFASIESRLKLLDYQLSKLSKP